MNESTIRWGILGTANIAQKNWQAIRHSGNGVVAAVASRDVERAKRFIHDCQAEVAFPVVPQAFGSYEALLASNTVDAVYVPLPTGLRKEWVIRAAEAGKHVLCEKPCAIDAASLREMIGACRRHHVQFMDGVMFMHSRRLQEMARVLGDGHSIGDKRRIESAFSFRGPEAFYRENIRAHSALEPHGCLGDLGWYCIRWALWAMNWKLPRAVTGRLLADVARADSPEAVPGEFSAELQFDGGASAGFFCSFLAGMQQWATVSGGQGYLRVSDFVLPYFSSEIDFEVHNSAYHVAGCRFDMEPRVRRVVTAEYSNNHVNSQEANLFRTFSDQVRSGRTSDFWPDIALKTQVVLDACAASARAAGQTVRID